MERWYFAGVPHKSGAKIVAELHGDLSVAFRSSNIKTTQEI
jgi:hypothetical protein